MRRRAGRCAASILWLSAAAIAGCAVAPVEPMVPLSPAEAAEYYPVEPPRPVRILTINVWSGLTYRGVLSMGRFQDDADGRRTALVEGIRALDPDIVAIQEANPLPRYARRLASDLDLIEIHRVALGGIRIGPIGIPWNLREGDAILAKPPATLVDLGTRRLDGGGLVSNGICCHTAEITQAVLARAIVNRKILYVYEVHLRAGSAPEDVDRRRREIANLAAFIDRTLPAGAHALLLGDFNATPESGELDPLLDGGRWVDAFGLLHPDGQKEGATWDPSTNPWARLTGGEDRGARRIDLILASDTIPRDRIRAARVVLGEEPGTFPSDHYGVLLEIWL
ncbi:MAG: endonuclease/exonuclease/phosphatase family protein [Planctomycetes bacterium]|nr:endonuclease/exonuclease/phosphatase family protein [Planctomycetota bacterium]